MLRTPPAPPPFYLGIQERNSRYGKDTHVIHSYEPNEVREGKVPIFPDLSLILTTRLSFISGTGVTQAWPTLRPTFPFPVLLEPLRTGSAAEELGWRPVEGMSKATRPSPGCCSCRCIRLTPRPGLVLWRANLPVNGPPGSTSFGFLLGSLHKDTKSLLLPT